MTSNESTGRAAQRRAAARKRYQDPENRAKQLERQNRWNRENRPVKHDPDCLKIKARTLVRVHVRDGKMTKPDACEKCGEDKPLHGHHEDYAKPLEVNWLCSQCHAERHDELRLLEVH